MKLYAIDVARVTWRTDDGWSVSHEGMPTIYMPTWAPSMPLTAQGAADTVARWIEGLGKSLGVELNAHAVGVEVEVSEQDAAMRDVVSAAASGDTEDIFRKLDIVNVEGLSD